MSRECDFKISASIKHCRSRYWGCDIIFKPAWLSVDKSFFWPLKSVCTKKTHICIGFIYLIKCDWSHMMVHLFLYKNIYIKSLHTKSLYIYQNAHRIILTNKFLWPIFKFREFFNKPWWVGGWQVFVIKVLYIESRCHFDTELVVASVFLYNRCKSKYTIDVRRNHSNSWFNFESAQSNRNMSILRHGNIYQNKFLFTKEQLYWWNTDRNGPTWWKII